MQENIIGNYFISKVFCFLALVKSTAKFADVVRFYIFLLYY